MNRFGIYIFPWGTSVKFSDLDNLARKAADAGFDVHIPTHFFLPKRHADRFGNEDVLEPLLVTSAIARNTKSVKIGVNSEVLPLLHPCAWAKFYATLDIITEGRLIAGMAVGWSEELEIFGVDRTKRGRITNEQIEIIKKLWTEKEVTYKGKFYNLEKVRLEPKCVQKPHPPIWIAGGGPDFEPAIKRTAKYGDVLLLNLPTLEEVKKVSSSLKEEARKTGRKAEVAAVVSVAISKDQKRLKDFLIPGVVEYFIKGGEGQEKADNVLKNALIGTPDECIKRVKKYLEAGLSYFVLDFQRHGMSPASLAMEQMQIFAKEVAPHFKR